METSITIRGELAQKVINRAAQLKLSPEEFLDAMMGQVINSDLFTPRELEVIGLVARGLSSKEIGIRLFISGKTVAVHRTNFMRKLGAHTSVEAISKVIRAGLI